MCRRLGPLADIENYVRELQSRVEALEQRQQFPQLMTSRQCAEYLSCSESALRLWRKCREQGERKGPPFLHVGHKTIFYDRDDVLEWARAHRVA